MHKLASERESTLATLLLFDGSPALDALLLLLELLSLSVELLLHLAVTGVQLLFALLEFVLLFLNLLLEYHLHFEFHLRELLLVQRALLLLLDSWVDLFEHARILSDTHRGELVGTVVLVQVIVGMLLEVFHVGADEHLSQLDKVAVLLVVDFDDTPWVSAAANLAAFGCRYFGVGTDDCERYLGHDLVILGNGLLVVELVAWALENIDVVVVDISKDLYSC